MGVVSPLHTLFLHFKAFDVNSVDDIVEVTSLIGKSTSLAFFKENFALDAFVEAFAGDLMNV